MRKFLNINYLIFSAFLMVLASCSDYEIDSNSVVQSFAPVVVSPTGTITSVTTQEPDGETYTFDYVLDENQIFDVTLNITGGSNGTAVEGEDFIINTPTIDLLAYEGLKGITISITILKDYLVEGDEEVYLSISGDDNYLNPAEQQFKVATIKDSPVCEYDVADISGMSPGTDVNLDGLGFAYDSEIVVSGSPDSFQLSGVGIGWMTDFWGEVVITEYPVEFEIVEDNAFVTIFEIPLQPYLETTYNGAAQPQYQIFGSAILTKCEKSLVIEYEYDQDGFNPGAWTHDNGYMTDEVFTARLTVP